MRYFKCINRLYKESLYIHTALWNGELTKYRELTEKQPEIRQNYHLVALSLWHLKTVGHKRQQKTSKHVCWLSRDHNKCEKLRILILKCHRMSDSWTDVKHSSVFFIIIQCRKHQTAGSEVHNLRISWRAFRPRGVSRDGAWGGTGPP